MHGHRRKAYYRSSSCAAVALYMLWGCNAHCFICRFRHYINCLLSSLRIGLFYFQAGGHKRRPNLALVFFVCFVCVIVYFVTNPCLLLLC